MPESKDGNGNLSRRDFLKVSGAAGAVLSLAGVATAGYAAGKDYDSYTGLTCPPKPGPHTMLRIRPKETGNAEKETLFN